MTMALLVISYSLFKDTLVASTGYNVSARGLFWWVESASEYDFSDDGQSILKNRKTTINTSALISEIALFMTISIIINTLIMLFLFLGNKLDQKMENKSQ